MWQRRHRSESEIKDIYRTNSGKETSKPIIVEFTSVLKKEKVLKATKDFNKTRRKEEKLSSETLKLPGTRKPIFLSETLTFKAQKLFYLSREFAKVNGYTFCWTSRGYVYLRKAENMPTVRIDTTADLENLKSKD